MMRKIYEEPQIEFEEYTVFATDFGEDLGDDSDSYSNNDTGDYICTGNANTSSY